MQLACGYFESCQNGQCAPFTALDNPLRSIGQDCSGEGISCGPGSYCALATMRCVAAPTLGMSCAVSQTCADGYCSKATQTCTAKPGLNQPCGVGALPGDAGDCAVGLVCSGAPATGSCVPAPSAGQQCNSGAILRRRVAL